MIGHAFRRMICKTIGLKTWPAWSTEELACKYTSVMYDHLYCNLIASHCLLETSFVNL